MPEPLERALERTDLRASLDASYLAGHAPASQRVNGQRRPDAPTYYGLPAIKGPEWKWPVPTYFLVGGLAAGAFVAAALLDMRGRREDRALVRAGRLVSLGGMVASPALLIADLGRPERFMNMLRVVRPRSMMNQGSWALVTLGGLCTIATVLEALERGSRRRPVSPVIRMPLRVLTWLGIVPAAFVGSYTGVLISATNVPLWAANRRLMGPLFLSTALSTGLAATRIVAHALGHVSHASAARAERAERLALGGELALVLASVVRLGRLARPLIAGPIGWLYQLGGVGLGLVAPLALARPARSSRRRSLATAILTLVGGAVSRFAIAAAGTRSANDPHAYFTYTRGTDRRARAESAREPARRHAA